MEYLSFHVLLFIKTRKFAFCYRKSTLLYIKSGLNLTVTIIVPTGLVHVNSTNDRVGWVNRYIQDVND